MSTSRMPISSATSRLLLVASATLTLAVAGCESSSTTSLGPSSVAKCQVAVNGSQLAVAAGGGAGAITVSAEAECAWTASAGANWISALTPSAGQGNGEIKFQASPNTGSAARQADISVNGATATVTQAGATCRIEISPRRETGPVEGGDGTVPVPTLSGCPWTVTSNASWLTTSVGPTGASAGTGPGTVRFSATANTGIARIGNIAIGDQTFVVTQQAVGVAQ
jgi:hypothetical protein